MRVLGRLKKRYIEDINNCIQIGKDWYKGIWGHGFDWKALPLEFDVICYIFVLKDFTIRFSSFGCVSQKLITKIRLIIL